VRWTRKVAEVWDMTMWCNILALNLNLYIFGDLDIGGIILNSILRNKMWTFL